MAIRASSRCGALVACVIALAAGACGQKAAPPPEPTSSAVPDYFGTTDFIGRTVTVHGTVTRVIGESSFEVDTGDYGDDSLLVLATPGRNVATGAQVEVTGNVQHFDYATYAGEYRLTGDAEAYAEFAGERFLVSSGAMSGG